MAIVLKCPSCGKEYSSPWVTKPQKFCSWRCYSSTLKGRKLSDEGRNNIAKANKLKIRRAQAIWAKTIRESPDDPKVIAWKQKITARQTNEKHFMWKGDNASYRSQHIWLERHYQKTGICQNCGGSGKTDWANKSGNYNRLDRSDWIELCRTCHKNYDFKYNIRKPEKSDFIR